MGMVESTPSFAREIWSLATGSEIAENIVSFLETASPSKNLMRAKPIHGGADAAKKGTALASRIFEAQPINNHG